MGRRLGCWPSKRNESRVSDPFLFAYDSTTSLYQIMTWTSGLLEQNSDQFDSFWGPSVSNCPSPHRSSASCYAWGDSRILYFELLLEGFGRICNYCRARTNPKFDPARIEGTSSVVSSGRWRSNAARWRPSQEALLVSSKTAEVAQYPYDLLESEVPEVTHWLLNEDIFWGYRSSNILLLLHYIPTINLLELVLSIHSILDLKALSSDISCQGLVPLWPQEIKKDRAGPVSEGQIPEVIQDPQSHQAPLAVQHCKYRLVILRVLRFIRVLQTISKNVAPERPRELRMIT